MVPVLLSCIAGWYLTGLSWTVALVSYPGFAASATGDWPRIHELHSRRIALAVGPMWALEAVACALWTISPPEGTLWMALLASLTAALTVVLTVAWAVPVHQRLSAGYDQKLARSLMWSHALRTATWSASAITSAIALGILLH
jgi:hypothetical protein